MRVKSSIINISTGIGSQIIMTILGFVSRTLFIKILGTEYLGVNGLFTNLLSMLSLTELGIGSSIIYSLYKPVAENDYVKINALLGLYKKAYSIIGLIVLSLGLAMVPFLHVFMKDSHVPHVYIIYLFFLLNTAFGYMYQHKISFLDVSQKRYISTGLYSLSSIISTIVKITILFITRNYLLYLLSDILFTIVTTLIVSMQTDKLYPQLKEYPSCELDEETKRTIIKNVKALILHNIGGYCVFGTDNIIISSFVSVAAVGLYSNYNMLLNICRTFINQVFTNINSSMGNLIAKENAQKIYSMFKVTLFFNFWIYSFFTIFLLVILKPLIIIWIGKQYLLGQSVVVYIMLNFYVSGMRNAISMVKTTSGIFHEDRYAPFLEAVINLGVSIVLVRQIGIAGVFIGTFASTLLVPFWIAPFLVYKKVFKLSVAYYFLRYIIYSGIGIGTYCLTNFISNVFIFNTFWTLVLRVLICLFIPNIIYFLLFFKTKEFGYLFGVFSHVFEKIFSQLKIKRLKKETTL